MLKGVTNFRSNLFQNDWGEFPVVLGRDCSGIVVAVGKDVTRIEQGDEVSILAN